jgi:hypothetical protein
MRKIKAKVDKHVVHHKHEPKHEVVPEPEKAASVEAPVPLPEPEPEVTVTPVLDPVLSEAAEILVKLAHSSSASLGTSSGQALIAAAQKWVGAYVTVDE